MRQSLKSFYRRWVVRPYIQTRRALRATVQSVRAVWAWLCAVWEWTAALFKAVVVRPVRVVWGWLCSVWGWLRSMWKWLRSAWRKTRAFFDVVVVRPAQTVWVWLCKTWRGMGTAWRWLREAWHWLVQAGQTTLTAFNRSFRQVAGWIVLFLGIITAPLPIPLGLPLIILGLVILGPHDPRVRWLGVNMRLCLRKLVQKRIPLLSSLARKALDFRRRFSQYVQ